MGLSGSMLAGFLAYRVTNNCVGRNAVSWQGGSLRFHPTFEAVLTLLLRGRLLGIPHDQDLGGWRKIGSEERSSLSVVTMTFLNVCALIRTRKTSPQVTGYKTLGNPLEAVQMFALFFMPSTADWCFTWVRTSQRKGTLLFKVTGQFFEQNGVIVHKITIESKREKIRIGL